jgi:hypothetical protein
MADYISRKTAKQILTALLFETAINNSTDLNASDIYVDIAKNRLDTWLNLVPSGDVCAKDCYDRILTENDTMREQLAQIGKKPGDKMNDVRLAPSGKWILDTIYPSGVSLYRCSHCAKKCFTFGSRPPEKFCSECGYDMRENS